MNQKQISLILLLVGTILSLGGCVSLSPQARQIQLVTNSQEISACERLGSITTETMKCVDPATCMGAATAEGRNEAAKLGATHLLTTYNGITLTHGVFDGVAYRCTDSQVGTQRMEIINLEKHSQFQGCAKDTECKGNRVCELGKCVSP